MWSLHSLHGSKSPFLILYYVRNISDHVRGITVCLDVDADSWKNEDQHELRPVAISFSTIVCSSREVSWIQECGYRRWELGSWTLVVVRRGSECRQSLRCSAECGSYGHLLTGRGDVPCRSNYCRTWRGRGELQRLNLYLVLCFYE